MVSRSSVHAYVMSSTLRSLSSDAAQVMFFSGAASISNKFSFCPRESSSALVYSIFAQLLPIWRKPVRALVNQAPFHLLLLSEYRAHISVSISLAKPQSRNPHFNLQPLPQNKSQHAKRRKSQQSQLQRRIAFPLK